MYPKPSEVQGALGDPAMLRKVIVDLQVRSDIL